MFFIFFFLPFLWIGIESKSIENNKSMSAAEILMIRKLKQIKEMNLYQQNGTNSTPFTKLCFKCFPGTVSTPACISQNTSKLLKRSEIEQSQFENVTCDEGYCFGNSSNCMICPAGTYSDGQLNKNGLSVCSNCSYGFYSDENRSVACNECEPRYYCPDIANTEMIPCPIGSFCNESRLSYPFICSPGYYCPKIELKAPLLCPPGYFCLGSTEPPQPCPENTRCPPGTTFPINCVSLFIANKESAVCSPTIAFWVIAAISIVAIFIFVGWLFFKISNMAMIEQEEIKSHEITKIIPPANGPKYTGL